MEVVGVVASVVTLTQLVIDGIKLAKTLYSAPDDLAALQEQLENFRTLVQEVDRSQGERTDNIVTHSLTRAKLSIEQLHQLIQVKLLKNLNSGTSRARRRAWARNKSKILALRDVLKECRDNLCVALSAKNLSSSAQTETSLAVIVQATGQSRQSLTSIDTRLFEIQQSLLTTQKAIDAQSHSLGHLLTSVSSKATAVDIRQPSPSRGRYLESSLNVRSRHPHLYIPAGSFELSGTFFPELYTTHEGPSSVPILIYTAFEEHSTAVSRTNHYQLFFLKTQRQWQRLSISLTVSKSSRFWDYTKLSTAKVAFASNSYNFPRSLQDKVVQLLWDIEDLHQDAHLSLDVSEQVNNKVDSPWCLFRIHQPTAERERAAKDVISNLDHLGCQRFCENEIVQIARLGHPSAFAVCMGNRLLQEFRISTLAEDFSLYTIQVLHCLQNMPGIARFAGVVIDRGGQELKSFLWEIPPRGWIWTIIAEAIDQGSNIDWNRRERWARDIVEGVCQAHSKGFVVGVLGHFTRTPISVDAADRALLFSFRNKTWPDNSLPGLLPPELRIPSPRNSRAYSRPRTEHLDVTAQCDIFQLGAVLWLIACDQKPRGWRHCCYYAGCSEKSICMEHADMITMPPLPPSVPKYYIELIASCRSGDPLRRPPAQKLLDMFPAKPDPRAASAEAVKETVLRALLGISARLDMVCDSCDDEIFTTAFHCNICDGGDYDICVKCMRNGIHCKDASHFLVEMNTKEGAALATNNYYSSIKRDGKRDIVHL